MTSERETRETLAQFFAGYYASSIQEVAQRVGCPLKQTGDKHTQLAHFLCQLEHVGALYRSCSDEEKRVLTVAYLLSGREEDTYYSSYRGSYKEAMSRLILKGLILVGYRGYGKVDLKYYYHSYSSSLMIHPLIQPLVCQEGSRWLPLKLAPESVRTRAFSHRRREQELYILCQWIARNPVSLTVKQLPNRQELRRLDKAISLSPEEGEKLCFWGLAIDLLRPQGAFLKVAPRWEDFFRLPETERLAEWGHSLPRFVRLLRERDYRFRIDTDIVFLAFKLLSLIPPEKWFDPQPLASWIEEQKLSFYTLEAIRNDLRLVLEEVFSFTGWVELGYQGDKLVAFRLTPQGAAALGRQALLPELSEERLVVQPNFEILAPVEQLSFWEAGLLEKIAQRKSSDVISTYHLSQNTLYRAAQEGISLEEILNFLATKSATGIPDNVQRSIEDWWADFLRIRVMENGLILEDNGSFSLLERDIPELPRVDYRRPPYSFASWEGGQIQLNSKAADLFTLEALNALARPARNGFQLDPERLKGLNKCSADYYSRMLEVLRRCLKFVPPELLLTLRAYRGEIGQISLISLPVVIFSHPEVVSSLMEVSWFREALIASVKNLAILNPEKVAEVRERLAGMGLTVGKSFPLKGGQSI